MADSHAALKDAERAEGKMQPGRLWVVCTRGGVPIAPFKLVRAPTPRRAAEKAFSAFAKSDRGKLFREKRVDVYIRPVTAATKVRKYICGFKRASAHELLRGIERVSTARYIKFGSDESGDGAIE